MLLRAHVHPNAGNLHLNKEACSAKSGGKGQMSGSAGRSGFRKSDMRENQPYWPDNLMKRYIRPQHGSPAYTNRSVGILFAIPSGTPLKAKGKDVKTVQELLQHATSRITLEVYTQAAWPGPKSKPRFPAIVATRSSPLPKVRKRPDDAARYAACSHLLHELPLPRLSKLR